MEKTFEGGKGLVERGAVTRSSTTKGKLDLHRRGIPRKEIFQPIERNGTVLRRRGEKRVRRRRTKKILLTPGEGKKKKTLLLPPSLERLLILGRSPV